MSISITIAARSTAATTPGGGNGSGGLPFTGIDVYALGGLSALLLLTGLAMLFTGRRRRSISA